MKVLKNKETWTNVLYTHFQGLNDIYFEFDYFDLFAKYFDVLPEALFWEDNNIKIFWSHFIRAISKINLFRDYNYFDLITPYGYGGPLLIKKAGKLEDIKKSLKKFVELYNSYAYEQNYICEFVRFHPFLKNWELLEEFINVRYLNDTVALDLTQSYEEICRNMSKKTRYYIRKALYEFEDYKIVKNPTQKEIEEFVELYNKTMEKNKAAKKYYFSIKFIEDHYKFDNLLIFCRNKDKKVGSSAIFLKGSSIIHYHLSATNYEFQNPPSRAVLWKAIEWAKENGFKWLHFGGGVSKNDSLFHFKKGFSRTYLPFYIGKIIFNKEVYDDLTSLNSLSKKSSGFFPLYRFGYDDTIV